MKKSLKAKLLGVMALLFGAVLLSGCTANFCSNLDRANIAYPYDQGVTVYCDKDQLPTDYASAGSDSSHPLCWQPFLSEGNTSLWAYIPVDSDGYFAAKKATYVMDNVIDSAVSSSYAVPSYDYFKAIDQKTLEAALEAAKSNGVTFADEATVTAAEINPFSIPDSDGTETGVTVNSTSILRNYGYLKFYGSDGNNWTNWDEWTNELKTTLGASLCPDSDFETLYQNTINTIINSARTCIATRTGSYGHYGENSNWQVNIESKDWSFSWSKGFLEGLIVYPVAWMVDNFSFTIDPALSGWGQIWALVFVTLIVRIILLAITFKSTLDMQKMQALQPQLAKLQAKYPNSTTNNAEKNRLAQETMILYKRNKVSMGSSFINILIQFPLFIAVWGALEGSSVLSSGEVLNLRLSDSIQTVLFNVSGQWYLNSNGWWTALVLFLLMAIFQVLSAFLPQWITKARTKNQAKLTVNPAADKNTQTMKFMMYGMIIFTILMGFALPAAMGVYWAISALLSMIQTVFMQWLMARQQKKNERRI